MKICNFWIFCLVTVLFLNVQNAFSDDFSTGDVVVCAEVMPCDDEGNVLEAYRGGECEEQYAQTCSLFYLNKKEVACQDKVSNYQRELDKKAKKIRKLQRRVNRLSKKR